jgi:cystathionine beta-lyase
MLAGTAAFSSDSDAWLDGVLMTLDRHRRLLADLLAEEVPAAVYRMPDAGYLAWIDLRGLGWGDDPARRILREAKVALHFGPHFGDEGRGFVRLNFACAEEVLVDAVRRIGALARS